MEKNTCPICHGHLDHHVNVDPKVYVAKWDGEIELLKCRDCEVLITNIDNKKSVYDLYQSDTLYTDHECSGFVTIESNPDLTQNYLNNRIRPIQNYKNTNVRYLDIGCSAGHLMSIAQREGWEVEGLEASPVSSDFAKKRGLNVHNTYLEDFNSEHKFDVISMFHVLEHVEDPVDTVQRVHKLLNDDGIFAIEVPNSSSLAAAIRKKDWHCYYLPFHFWHFSKKSLIYLLEENGFEVLKIKTPYAAVSSSHIFNVHRFITKIIKSILGKKDTSTSNAPAGEAKSFEETGVTTKGSLKHRIISFLMVAFYYPFDKALSLLGLADDLYLLARKK